MNCVPVGYDAVVGVHQSFRGTFIFRHFCQINRSNTFFKKLVNLYKKTTVHSYAAPKTYIFSFPVYSIQFIGEIYNSVISGFT